MVYSDDDGVWWTVAITYYHALEKNGSIGRSWIVVPFAGIPFGPTLLEKQPIFQGFVIMWRNVWWIIVDR